MARALALLVILGACSSPPSTGLDAAPPAIDAACIPSIDGGDCASQCCFIGVLSNCLCVASDCRPPTSYGCPPGYAQAIHCFPPNGGCSSSGCCRVQY